MAQGEGISVLLRAYQITHDEAYLDGAWQAFGAFHHSVFEGGVGVRNEKDLWFEEFPTQPPSHVLNGFIFALFGVFDLYRVTDDTQVHSMWERGIQTLVNNLHRYDLGFWSCYDLTRRQIASSSYHYLHILQLQVLAQITDESTFINYARRWQNYNTARRSRLLRFVVGKGRGALRRAGLVDTPAVEGVRINLPGKKEQV